MENTLTLRAERALLGAILLAPASVEAALASARIDHTDFKSADHAVLYLGVRGGDDMPEMERKLAELRASCLAPRHGPAYAAMVVEASGRRFLNDTSAGPTDWAIGVETRRLTAAVRAAGSRAEEYAAHVAQFVRPGRFDPDVTRVPPRPAKGGVPTSPQDLLLAALIQRHPQTDAVLSALLPAAFGDPLQRGIYEAIRALREAGWPVDPLTVDWELARSHLMSGDPSGHGLRPRAENEPSYATWLAQVPAADSLPLTKVAKGLMPHRPGQRSGRASASPALDARKAGPRLREPGRWPEAPHDAAPEQRP